MLSRLNSIAYKIGMQTFLFIPGYYGTTLIEEKTNHLVWGDPKEVMFGKKSLARPIPGVDLPKVLDLKPHELIQDVRLVGGLIREDAYNRTISLLKTIGGPKSHIETVPWDWRQDPIHGVHQLHNKVLQVKRDRPNDELILISHSFGSVVAAYYLRYGIQDYFNAVENWAGLNNFSKVVMAAAPFRGLMAMFRNMHKGVRLLLNTSSQSPLAMSTFESSYYLLPPPGRDLIKDEKLNSMSLDLHKIESWSDNNWGLFHHRHPFRPETLKHRLEYVSNHLARAKKLHQLMDAPIKSKPPKRVEIMYFSGHGSKTVHEGVWLKSAKTSNVFLYYPKDFKKWLPKTDPEIVYGDGDQTVPDFSAELPPAFKSLDPKILHMKLGHLEILQSARSQNYIHEFLIHR